LDKEETVRKIKMIGLAAVAVLALTASVGVASASATDVSIGDDGTTTTFQASAYPAYLSGTALTDYGWSRHTFTFPDKGNGSVTCDVDFSSQTDLTKASPSIALYADYSNCTGTLNSKAVDADVNMNSCYYSFHSDGTPTPPFYAGQLDVKCAWSGDAIEVTRSTVNSHGHDVPQCEMSIPAQSNINNIELETIGSGIGIGVTSNNIQYSKEHGVLCGTYGTTYTNGSYQGATILYG
jgi:hypothetical protein